MSEFKGTKWMSLAETKTGKFKVVDNLGFSIATSSGYGKTDKANIQLFSCSYEMLEMLEDCKGYMEMTGNNIFREKIEQLITKSTTV